MAQALEKDSGASHITSSVSLADSPQITQGSLCIFIHKVHNNGVESIVEPCVADAIQATQPFANHGTQWPNAGHSSPINLPPPLYVMPGPFSPPLRRTLFKAAATTPLLPPLVQEPRERCEYCKTIPISIFSSCLCSALIRRTPLLMPLHNKNCSNPLHATPSSPCAQHGRRCIGLPDCTCNACFHLKNKCKTFKGKDSMRSKLLLHPDQKGKPPGTSSAVLAWPGAMKLAKPSLYKPGKAQPS